MREEHTPFYFNKEVDQALRECDEARTKKLQANHRAKLSALTPVIPDDGYADGGEPYTDEELDIINKS